MTTHALTHDRERSGLARWIGVGFLSGALAVLLFHQPIAALLHSLGVTPRAPYSMQATQPFGLPQLWSLVFWGAVWGVALAAALRRLDGASLVLAATVFSTYGSAPVVAATTSTAPISTLAAWGRLMPRWSVAGAPVLVPASMAGLPAKGRWVKARPPLSFSEPSPGS